MAQTDKKFIFQFKQHAYNLIHHHVELVYVNNTLMEATLNNVKPNRTYPAFDANVALKVKLYGDQFKRHYTLHNFNIPDELLTPNVPEGYYMIQLVGFWGKSVLCEVKWFGSVKYMVKKMFPNLRKKIIPLL